MMRPKSPRHLRSRYWGKQRQAFLLRPLVLREIPILGTGSQRNPSEAGMVIETESSFLVKDSRPARRIDETWYNIVETSVKLCLAFQDKEESALQKNSCSANHGMWYTFTETSLMWAWVAEQEAPALSVPPAAKSCPFLCIGKTPVT